MDKYFYKRIIAIILSGGLVVLVLSVTLFVKKNQTQQEQQVLVREIDFALPPPPPPPEETQIEQESLEMSIDIALNAAGPPIQFSQKPVLNKKFMAKLEKPNFDIKKVDWKKSFQTNFPEVDMSELDKVPTIVSNTTARIPRALRKRGIKRVKVKLKILIDETGKTYLRRFVDSVYPEMEPVVREYIKTVRYTAPTRDGRPVHAVYSWTLSFKEVM